MRTIYTDSENKCHVTCGDGMIAVEVDHFDGKCDFFVEGHCCVVDENSVAIYPWKDYAELDEAQRAYERQLLDESIPTADLKAAYQEGVNSAYG